jgi:hypothetical protein
MTGGFRAFSARSEIALSLIQRCGGLGSANSGVEPFDKACPELVEGLRTGSLGGLADVKDRLKPRLQQSKRIDPQYRNSSENR